jgi:alpha-beta hydrolase superfamily lysophospholipase
MVSRADGSDRFSRADEKFTFADEPLFVDYRVRMSTRASFVKSLAAGAGATTLGFSPALARTGGVEDVVLVHGLYADGSRWSEVIVRLKSAGKRVTSVENPLHTCANDVATAKYMLAMQQAPTLLVAHSYGGMVATEAWPSVQVPLWAVIDAPEGEDGA